MTASHFSEIIKEEANKLVGKAKRKAPVLSTEDQEIKQQENRWKEMRKKKSRSEREKVEYTKLNKTVKKRKRSADKDHERNEQIMLKLYFKVVEDQNRYKRGPKKKYVK